MTQIYGKKPAIQFSVTMLQTAGRKVGIEQSEANVMKWMFRMQLQ